MDRRNLGRRFRRVIFSLFLLTFFISCSCNTAVETKSASSDISVEQKRIEIDRVNSLFMDFDKKFMNAAVKVMGPGGLSYGSGTYVKFRGFDLVLTASHVVGTNYLETIVVVSGDEAVPGRIVYSDEGADLAAVLLSKPIESRRPMRYSPLKKTAAVGEYGAYSGFPGGHDLLTMRGMVVGYEKDQVGGEVILFHTFGWYGSSGSGIYDAYGNLIGILWGIEIQFAGIPQIIEDILYITPANRIDESKIMDGICLTENDTRACLRHVRRQTR